MDNVSQTPPTPFPNLQAGMNFLARLPLAQPAAAEEQLALFLDALLESPPKAAELLVLLEQARPTLAFVAGELAGRYRDRPLVLSDGEEAVFRRVTALWSRMGKAYALCLPAAWPPAQERALEGKAALILQRGIACTGMIVQEHYRARRELPCALWLELHSLYRRAEVAGLAMQAVEDALAAGGQARHCTGAYAALLLMDLAGPYRQSARDFEVIRRWAANWAGLVRIEPIGPGEVAPRHVLELDKALPVHPAPADGQLGADARRVVTTRLIHQLGEVHSKLKQRVPPAELGLGDETPARASALIERLGSPWSLVTAPRRFRRFKSTGLARVGAGFEAMYSLVSGHEFVQPDAAKTYSRGQFDALFSFRDRAEPVQKPGIRAEADYPVDDWEVCNHSASGFRLARSSAGQKMRFAQLVTICPHDETHFLLAQVRWVLQEQEGGLRAGISLLPGVPAGVAVRQAGGNGGKEPFVRAFMLPAVAAINEPASLVLPHGIYQASRELELWGDEGGRRLLMKGILEQGVDFDRVAFEAL